MQNKDVIIMYKGHSIKRALQITDGYLKCAPNVVPRCNSMVAKLFSPFVMDIVYILRHTLNIAFHPAHHIADCIASKVIIHSLLVVIIIMKK